MKTIIFINVTLITSILLSTTMLLSQQSEEGTPASFRNKSSLRSPERIEKTTLKEVDVEKLRAEDRDETGGVARAGIGIPVEIDILKEGTWEQLPSGEYICRYRIQAKDAPAVSLFYSNFKMAPGDKLFYYNEAGDKVYGAFTEKNNKPSGKFATAMLFSDVIVLEFVSPQSKEECQSQIVIESVVNYYIYGRLTGQRDNDNEQECISHAATCHIGINCSGFPQNWQNEKLGVAMIAKPELRDNILKNVGFCSGSLINNTNTDGAPLFLTAQHCTCGDGDAITNPNQDQYIFYWDFEAPQGDNTVCNQNCPLQNFYSTCGAYILSNGRQSDFSLLYLKEQNNIFPRDLNGWDRSFDIDISAGTGIHHPKGNAKKITKIQDLGIINEFVSWNCNEQVSACLINSLEPSTHIICKINSGTLEKGSSGSSLFNANKLIIGNLNGGIYNNNDCIDNIPPCDIENIDVYYGFLAYSWTNNNNSSIHRRLDHWLDPKSLGNTQLNSQSFGVPSSLTGNPQILSTTISCQGNNTFHLLMNATAPFGVYEIVVGNVRDTVVIHTNPYVYNNYFPGSPSLSSPVVIILKPLYTDPINTMQDQESVICTINCTLDVTSNSAPSCQNPSSFLLDFIFSVSGTGGTYHVTDGNTPYPNAMPDQSYLFGPFPNGTNVNITVSGNNGCIRTFTYTANCTSNLACTQLTSPINGATGVSSSTNISWSPSSGVTGYKLTIGTTPGGTQILNNANVGNVTSYNPPADFAYNATIYVKITPYNTNGDATGCIEESFTTGGDLQSFITTWKTDNPGTSCSTCITIPTTGIGYNYDVDWNNDGVFDQLGITGNVTHNFGVGGTYTIRIRGSFPRIYFNNTGDRQKILSINQWGSIVWTSMANSFFGCSNLEFDATDAPNLINVNSLSRMFYNCSSFNGNIGNWNTQNVTDMSFMFRGTSSFNQPIGSWNTQNVTNLFGMFWDASSFNQPIGNWNTQKVTNMSNMFYGASSFNQPIGNWNTQNVTDMSFMFRGTSSFNQPIGSWNTQKVTNMSEMFNSAYSFNQAIGNWNTSAVTNMSWMFASAHSFNQVIGNWSTQIVTNMSTMFASAWSFNQNIGSWSLNTGVNVSGLFNFSGMDCENYSATLLGWGNNINTPSNRNLGALGMQYGTNAIAARDYLINNKGWTISGDGPSGTICELLPTCTALTIPTNGATNVPISTNITWTTSADASGYKLTIGTTPGGNQILNNANLGNATTFDPPNDFPNNSTVYVRITPYNSNGDAIGCVEESFTTCSIALTLTGDDSPLSGTYMAAEMIQVVGNVSITPNGNVLLKAPLVKVSNQFNLSNQSNLTISPDGCGPPFVCGTSTVSFIYNGTLVTYGTVVSSGRCWLDRNLGASQVATSSTDAAAYGDLFQWGRGADGHQRRNPLSLTTSNLAIDTDSPGHGLFITTNSGNFDWRSPQNNNLWQGVNGINNPCPSGFRLPTEAELNTERTSWSSNNVVGAFTSPLKLPVAGYRNGAVSGSVNDVGFSGIYWSSSVDGTRSDYLYFVSGNAVVYSHDRANGFSLRCIKDEGSPTAGSIGSLNCAGATNNGTLSAGTSASGVSSIVPYTGGNGGTHNGQTVTSTGVIGLTATLSAASFVSGSGSLTFTITGTPSSSGTASFVLNIGGQSCALTRTVNLPAGSITTLNCAGATNNGTLTAGTSASGVSSIVPYTGGNGGTHSGQTVTSTGVTGLTATLIAGSFVSGSGSLTYTITGTPSSSGTASFALNIGGQSCTLPRTVGSGSFTCGTSTVTFTYNGSPVTYGTVVSAGRCWLDRNLGASQVATSSNDAAAYGDLFQWGRGADGHQIRTPLSQTTQNLAINTDNPGHGLFITTSSGNYDWRSPQNHNLWQGANGINNPCPIGFRLPTYNELFAEYSTWASNNALGAFNSPLKLTLSGGRLSSNGSLLGVGSEGIYWTRDNSGINSVGLIFYSLDADFLLFNRADGFSLRCTKD